MEIWRFCIELLKIRIMTFSAFINRNLVLNLDEMCNYRKDCFLILQSNILDVKMLTLSAAGDNTESYSETTGDGSLTGKVGTALYVSPEMMTGASKIVYTQVSIPIRDCSVN